MSFTFAHPARVQSPLTPGPLASCPHSMTSLSSRSGLPRGTIAAIVVAAFLGLVIGCLAIFFFLRYRRRVISHRQRSFSPSGRGGEDHTGGVLDIGPGGGDGHSHHDDKGKEPAHEGSLSFTLDLPIQSNPNNTSSQRGYSEDGVQGIPRSPTVSLVRPQVTHARDSSRGALLIESPVESPRLEMQEHSPFHIEFATRSREGSADGQLSARRSHGGGLPSTPTLPQASLPHVNIIGSSPGASHREGSSDDNRNTVYSFLDISPESSLRGPPSVAQSSSSSSDARNRVSQMSEQSYAPDRPISLGFAFDYHRSMPALMPARGVSPIPASPPPGSLATIRPLPRLPLSPLRAETDVSTGSSMTPQPQSQSQFSLQPEHPPALRVQTVLSPPTRRPRSLSASAAAATSGALSSGNTANIVLHSPLQVQVRRSVNLDAVSPTDSIPVTVSDIHFRHSSDENTDDMEQSPSRRTSASRPGHPPLPQREYASPFIVQKLLGPQAIQARSGQGYEPGSTPAPGSGRPLLGSGSGHTSRPSQSTLRPHQRQASGQVRAARESEESLSSPRFAPGLGRPDW